MTKQFEKLGVQFSYPENWEVDADELQESDNIVSIYGPNGCFWSLQINPANVDPQAMADEALRVMQEEYEGLESTAAQRSVGSAEMLGHDMHFICLDLTNTATVRAFGDETASYLIFCQAEDRDWEQVEQVFAAITASLLAE